MYCFGIWTPVISVLVYVSEFRWKLITRANLHLIERIQVGWGWGSVPMETLHSDRESFCFSWMDWLPFEFSEVCYHCAVLPLSIGRGRLCAFLSLLLQETVGGWRLWKWGIQREGSCARACFGGQRPRFRCICLVLSSAMFFLWHWELVCVSAPEITPNTHLTNTEKNTCAQEALYTQNTHLFRWFKRWLDLRQV